MKTTQRHPEALNALDAFVMRHREALEEYMTECGLARKRIKEAAEGLKVDFEDAAGVRQHITIANAQDDDNAAPLVVPSALVNDLNDYEGKLTKELIRALMAIRNSDKYKRIIDMRDELAREKSAARLEALTPEDHPLIAVRKQPEEDWMVGLDEMNYDRAHATTIEEIAKVEHNLRQLEAGELNEKAKRDRAEENLRTKGELYQWD